MIARLLTLALASALAMCALTSFPAASDQPYLRSPALNDDGGRAFH